MSARHQRGLTLIELLVVMGIIIFLSTYLLVSLSRSAHVKALEAGTTGTIQQVELALTAYERDEKHLPPDLKTLLLPRTKTVVIGEASDPRSVRTVTLPPALVLPREQISKDGKDILDAWGDPLHYDPTRTARRVWSDHLNGP